MPKKIEDGGLKLIDFKTKVISLKLAWIPRLVSEMDESHAKTFFWTKFKTILSFKPKKEKFPLQIL